MELDPEFQAEVLEKERSLGGDHFSVLGVSPEASAEEIRAAYHAASRRFHPDRFFRKDLGAYGPKLERIFRRLNEANAVLSDPARRAAYLAAHPELLQAKAAPQLAPERLDERRSRLARHPYLLKASRGRETLARAKRLIDSGDAALALEILNELLRAEPNNEAVGELIAEARRKQELKVAEASLRTAEQAEAEGKVEEAIAHYQRALAHLPHHARASFRLATLLSEQAGGMELARVYAKRACELEPRNADHRALLAKVLVELGAKKLARKELDAALELSPQHRDANLLLKRVRWSLLGGD